MSSSNEMPGLGAGATATSWAFGGRLKSFIEAALMPEGGGGGATYGGGSRGTSFAEASFSSAGATAFGGPPKTSEIDLNTLDNTFFAIFFTAFFALPCGAGVGTGTITTGFGAAAGAVGAAKDVGPAGAAADGAAAGAIPVTTFGEGPGDAPATAGGAIV